MIVNKSKPPTSGLFQSRKFKITVKGLTDIDDYYPSESHGLFCDIQYDAERKETVIGQSREKTQRGVFRFLLNLFGVPTDCDERHDERGHCLPLDEIKVKPNRRLVADYSYWFHNH